MSRASDPAKRPADDDVYAIREPDLPPRPTAEPLVLTHAPIVTWEPPPPTIRQPFLRGVLTFPFYPRTIGPWGLIAVGTAITLLGFTLCWWLAENADAMITVRFIVPVFCLSFVITGSYTSACMLLIIEQTAAGYDKIDEWPPGEFREWIWSLLTVGVPLALAGAAGTIMSLASAWPVGVAATWFLYPLFLLSAIENGSLMAVYAPNVWRSLATVWHGWACLYLETGALVLVTLWFAWRWFPEEPWMTMLLISPVLAAVFLIFARFLGRIMWCHAQRSAAED